MERFLDVLTLEQARQGLAPAVLVHDRGRSGRTKEEGRWVWRCRSHGQWLFTPIAPGWPRQLAAILRAHRPHVLHLHLPNPSAFAALLLPAARRIPWVVHWHADIPEDTTRLGLRLAYPVYARIEHRVLARAAAIVATSRRYLDASRPLRAHLERCHVVPLGLGEPPAPGPAPCWPEGGLRVLAVGRLSYYKGFDRLVEALAQVPSACALICGSGPLATPLRQRIQALGLTTRVILREGLDDAAIEACFRSCDVVCLPSVERAEAFGLVLLEAMRAGRAVIASDLPGSGMAELVEEGRTGLKVPPGDPAALAAALWRLAGDSALCRDLGEAGRARFEQAYRITPVAEAIARIYRSVLARG